MVMVDIFCNNENCDYIKQDVMVDTSLDDHGECTACGKGKLKRMMPGQISFELKYNNKTDMCDWDGNTSQFWKGINSKDELPEKHRDTWY